MFSVEEINEMQKTIERQNRIITVLKRTVKQWVKEYNILDEIIEMYKMSENEAKEIIAELEAENEKLKEEIKEVKKYQYEQEYLEKEIETAKVNLNIGKEEARHYLHEAYKFQKCLQEIKAIVCGNYEIIDPQGRKDILKLITKAEEE